MNAVIGEAGTAKVDRLRITPPLCGTSVAQIRTTPTGDANSVETDVFEVERLAADAAQGRSDPVGEFAGFGDAAAH
jgi:hypothetical protein